ncbi:MAG: hypothetical protein QE263_08650 [Vampirovibrionales bacterium]|nr:hypothetical protein [Vampirovibrionales bacterium]
MRCISPENSSFAQLAEFAFDRGMLTVNEVRGFLNLDNQAGGDCNVFNFKPAGKQPDPSTMTDEQLEIACGQGSASTN